MNAPSIELRPPLFAAESVRVDVSGVPVIENLSATVDGTHVLVLGASRVLLEAAAGLLTPTSGKIRVFGTEPEAAIRGGVAAVALFDMPFPASWTTADYVVWSARLSGRSRPDAEVRATAALHALMLDPHATTKVQSLTVAGKRAASVAAAMATGAPVLILDDPSRGLPDDVARALGRVLANALSDHKWVLFAGEMSLSSPLSLESDNALVVHGGRVVAEGPPAAIASECRTYSVVLDGDPAQFSRELSARGARILWRSGAELAIELGATLRTRDLLALAARIDVTILELSPLGFALRA